MKRNMGGILSLIVFAGITLAGLATGNPAVAQEAEAPPASAEPVLSTGETILGQPPAYLADADAHVTAVIVTLPPGAETGSHHHGVPLFGYMLDGELTVAYAGADTRVYRPGDALMEAIGTSHNGRNTGSEPVRILAVFIGAEGIPDTVASE